MATRSVLMAAVACALLAAQDRPPDEPEENLTFKTRVNLVLVPVVVRDAAGRAVGNLTRDDFELFDKGKRQTLRAFSVIARPSSTESNKPGEAGPTEPGNATSAAVALTAHPLARRFILYLFDDLNGSIGGIAAVREAALRHFKSGIDATDRAAIDTFSGRTKLGFTSDVSKVEQAVADLRLRPAMGHTTGTRCPDVSYYLADLILNAGDADALEAVTRQTIECAHVNPFQAEEMAESAAREELFIGEQDTALAVQAASRAVRLMAQMPGQRLLVLASSGFFAFTPEGRAGVARVLDRAARAHVMISTLDPRGVDASGLMEASRSSEMSSLEQRYYRQSALTEADVLADIAEGSGGVFFHNNNDLAMGFERVAAAPEFSYLLGFSPANMKTDGSFHRLKVRVQQHGGFTVQARRGYYALKEPGEAEMAAAEIHDAVFSQEEMSGVPVDIVTQVSKSGSADAMLMVAAKVHLGSLGLRKTDGRNRGLLTIVSAVFDADGGYVGGNSKTVNLALEDQTLAHSDPGLNMQSDFQMKPGSYSVRVVVRDSTGDTIAAHSVKVAVR